MARELFLYWGAGADHNGHSKSSKLYYKHIFVITCRAYVYILSVRHIKWAVGLCTHSQRAYVHVSVRLYKALVT